MIKVLALLALLPSAVSASPAPCLEPLPRWEIVRRQGLHFSSWAEIERFYARQYHCAQPRIKHAWAPSPDGRAYGVMERGDVGHGIVIPRVFVERTIAQLELMLDGRTARRLSFMDLNHCHLHMKKAHFEPRYAALWKEGRWAELFGAALADPELRCVYHSQELLEPKDPPRELLGDYSAAARVLPMDTLPMEGRLEIMKDHQGMFGINFQAHPLGAYALEDGTRFDISFEGGDWDYAMLGIERPAEPPSDN